MEEIYKNLSSPAFWVLGIITGIIFSMIASYLRSFFDAFLSKISVSWSNRTAKKRKERRETIESLVGNKEAQLEMTQEEFRNRITLIYYLIGVLYFVLAIYPKIGEMNFRDLETPITVYIFLSILIGAFSHHSKSLNLMDMIKEAQEREKEKVKSEEIKTAQ